MRRLSREQLATRLPAFWMLGRARRGLGRFDVALADIERGAAIATDTGRESMLAHFTIESAADLIELGRLAEASAAAEQGVERARVGRNPRTLLWAQSTLASARLAAGDVAAALQLAEPAAESPPRADILATAQPGWCLGAALTAAGNPERAVRGAARGVRRRVAGTRPADRPPGRRRRPRRGAAGVRRRRGGRAVAGAGRDGGGTRRHVVGGGGHGDGASRRAARAGPRARSRRGRCGGARGRGRGAAGSRSRPAGRGEGAGRRRSAQARRRGADRRGVHARRLRCAAPARRGRTRAAAARPSGRAPGACARQRRAGRADGARTRDRRAGRCRAHESRGGRAARAQRPDDRRAPPQRLRQARGALARGAGARGRARGRSSPEAGAGRTRRQTTASSPSRCATPAASVRERTSSLDRMRETWTLAVFSAM